MKESFLLLCIDKAERMSNARLHSFRREHECADCSWRQSQRSQAEGLEPGTWPAALS